MTLDPAGLEAAAKAAMASKGSSEACDTGQGDCGGTHTDCYYRSLAADAVRAYLAAAGRAAATPDPRNGCRAPHCFSEYGTPCGNCPVAEKPETDT